VAPIATPSQSTAIVAVGAMAQDPSGIHNGIFASPTQRNDELRRIAAFLRRTSP
jgi:hypothetical protein